MYINNTYLNGLMRLFKNILLNIYVMVHFCCSTRIKYRGSYMNAPLVANLSKLLHECLCFIEFIKRVEEKR